jgi:hypothetical protein
MLKEVPSHRGNEFPAGSDRSGLLWHHGYTKETHPGCVDFCVLRHRPTKYDKRMEPFLAEGKVQEQNMECVSFVYNFLSVKSVHRFHGRKTLLTKEEL